MVCMSQALLDCHAMSLSQQMVQANQFKTQCNQVRHTTKLSLHKIKPLRAQPLQDALVSDISGETPQPTFQSKVPG